ncbi:uncharacterized protein ASPGLDRAFT_1224285 [Aspergillus glaucus CBS 516.65]|uniref:Uncharacterized protein n=1 Tax=Aspergillus glaucus CBS 516.65 TaxID=1160497 RepID=A0A1L9VR54_ASPGL|nr:hypothetical protein ASPGLDRAFT_1224285 [Aspergillus glaucus CBS 516.65]OJJ86408.1 hypothetical protein ASPGLDRAFT_1224285 [Aspergillus glaucus CBS 516.65]
MHPRREYPTHKTTKPPSSSAPSSPSSHLSPDPAPICRWSDSPTTSTSITESETHGTVVTGTKKKRNPGH